MASRLMLFCFSYLNVRLALGTVSSWNLVITHFQAAVNAFHYLLRQREEKVPLTICYCNCEVTGWQHLPCFYLIYPIVLLSYFFFVLVIFKKACRYTQFTTVFFQALQSYTNILRCNVQRKRVSLPLFCQHQT